MSCGVGHRHSLDLVLLWLWYRPAAAAPIRTLAWESLYATGSALKRQKKKKKRLLQGLMPGNIGKTGRLVSAKPLAPPPS